VTAEQREKKNAQQRERYATDSAYREKKLEHDREYHRVKYATDPEYRARKAARNERRVSTPSGERITLPDRETVEFARETRDDYRDRLRLI
jgi:hypothetical protein